MSKKITKKQSIWFMANRRRKKRKTEKTGKEDIPPIFPIRANLEAYTWAELDYISTLDIAPNAMTDELIRAKYNFGIGDKKTFVMNGLTYNAQIIGVNHDDFADGSGKAGLTFQSLELYKDMAAMNLTNTNVGGWQLSNMRTVTLPAIRQLLPQDIQSVLKTVNKLAANGGNQAGVTVIPTAEDLFLLSAAEVLPTAGAHSGEGNRYQHWAEGSTDNGLKFIAGTSESPNWWVRSTQRASASNGLIVATIIGSNMWVVASSSDVPRGVSFAFCV